MYDRVVNEFLSGKVTATFDVGNRLDDSKESYEQERLKLEAMKIAFVMIGRHIETMLEQIKLDASSGKIPVKESAIATKYVSMCLDVARKLFNESETKRLAADGAISALTLAVKSVKEMYDLLLKEVNDGEVISAQNS